MQLKTNDASKQWQEKNTTIHDYNEMKRRIYIFQEKWDNILWIDEYIETYRNVPTLEEFATKKGITREIASVYLSYHKDKEEFVKKDLDELLMDFNVYNDCILWWSIIISTLKTLDSSALWRIFGKVAESYAKFVDQNIYISIYISMSSLCFIYFVVYQNLLFTKI